MAVQFKQILAQGGIARTFALARVIDPVVIDLFALAGGYDGFWLDAEHVRLTGAQMQLASLAARANGFDCFARIPPVGYWLVTQCLEAGLNGVMGAQIQSAEQAEEFVRWARFAPRGTRGLNVGGRDANYTHMPAAEFVESASRRQLLGIQIETVGALSDVDRIAAIDGVDLLFIGPADLSLALGVVGQFHHEKLWEAIHEVSRACRRHGKAWGAVTPDASFAQRALEAGCQMPTYGNDALALRRGIEALKATFQQQFMPTV